MSSTECDSKTSIFRCNMGHLLSEAKSDYDNPVTSLRKCVLCALVIVFSATEGPVRTYIWSGLKQAQMYTLFYLLSCRKHCSAYPENHSDLLVQTDENIPNVFRLGRMVSIIHQIAFLQHPILNDKKNNSLYRQTELNKQYDLNGEMNNYIAINHVVNYLMDQAFACVYCGKYYDCLPTEELVNIHLVTDCSWDHIMNSSYSYTHFKTH